LTVENLMHALENIILPILAVLGVFLAIQVPFVLLTFIVALRETHRRAVYVRVEEAEALPSNAYMDLTNAMAEKQGFSYLGVCRAGNDKLYRIRYDTWISPDRDVFAVVGAGRMAAIPSQATILTSKLTDGRVLITVDNPGAMGGDSSGMTEWKVLTNADFPELLAKHRARIEAEMTPVEPYSDRDPLGDHLELNSQRVERMARAGHLYFLDDERDRWRYTAWGAVVRVCETYKRAFVQILKNYGRRTMSRPGDYGYIPSQRVATRSWLRYVELGLWIAIIVIGRLWGERPAMTPRQAAFRGLTLLGAFLGLAAIRIWRWRISRATVDPRTRRRRRYTVAAVACLVVGGCYMARPYREPLDVVNDCKVLVGGGRVYVVVEGARVEFLTSRLAKCLERAGRPGIRRMVAWDPSVDILESDGTSARSVRLPGDAVTGRLMPVGEHLYMIDPFEEGGMSQWRDGELVPVPADEREEIRKKLADDLAAQCASQGWECTVLGDEGEDRLSRTVPLGDRKVLLDLALGSAKANSSRVLHAKIEVPGAESLVRTFPPSRGDGS
jgi:hypothetical protein